MVPCDSLYRRNIQWSIQLDYKHQRLTLDIAQLPKIVDGAQRLDEKTCGKRSVR
ncbi:MAG: hypothetical protein ACI8PP_002700 [Candidatus Pseudothioglobus sp.]|jgi:hypothetical protein